MRILHTADWHIGKRLDTFSRLEEQRQVLGEICEVADAENVDAVVIAGDLFDNFNPSSEATELLYSTLHRLSANGSRAVIAIAGNHDSPERIQVPDALARVCGIIFVGYPSAHILPFKTQGGIELTRSEPGFFELNLPSTDIPLRIIHTPYANEQRLKTFLGTDDSEDALRVHLQNHWTELAEKYMNDEGFNLLTTHLYVTKKGDPAPEEEPDDERPILHIGGAQAIYSENFPKNVHYVALGHLHRYHSVDQNPPIVYSSSPLAYSFSEANQNKYVILLDAEKGKLKEYRPIQLRQGKKLRTAQFDSVDNAIAWLEQYPDDLIELTIVSETYLEAIDKKRLMEAHKGIVQIIPRISNINQTEQGSEIDLSLSIDKLFLEYFKSKSKGQQPSEGLMEVFREVLGSESEDNF